MFQNKSREKRHSCVWLNNKVICYYTSDIVGHVKIKGFKYLYEIKLVSNHSSV